ncbi:MAG TPA: hypothetical protein VE398_02850, partial [Acidobacteriota bacterium]|nr:hypothetical protein [Acidobacteriota bacterium]
MRFDDISDRNFFGFSVLGGGSVGLISAAIPDGQLLSSPSDWCLHQVSHSNQVVNRHPKGK